ncbi:hypothetical protein HIM_06929 [Hirsutella minnesotensis 3608]|uniref:Phosphogluconate dehydrogenase NAD-binding putative C-terminal domain-containing protein n=1 Tax=Hirsutella minnesotensis 3608 TaxID=1043627 RepID=A0A0F7ZIC1_9HYPO|nr:hypothetical protein HIM_06929 [Hirsutella minnesotensis 3608]
MSPASSDALTVGILSLGDMGAGIARLLVDSGFSVVTNCSGRSEETVRRARDAGVRVVSSDLELVQQSAVILSVVPPRDAEATAQRVIDALSEGSKDREPLFFVELNAVSPSTCKEIRDLFDRAQVPARFVDGCILGAPPSRKAGAGPGSDTDSAWKRPSIPVSGPHEPQSMPGGERLASALNMRRISSEVGAASGLKMCFAALNKGYTAIATQAFTTAHRLGVAGELRRELAAMAPAKLKSAECGVPDMAPKAYRWVREMEEIAETMSGEGGWGEGMFRGAAAVYSAVAEDEILGAEKVGSRTRGETLEEVAAIMADSLSRRGQTGRE